jgi:hypothetical protein
MEYYILKTQFDSDRENDTVEQFPFYAQAEKRIREKISAAVLYTYPVKMILTYADTVRVFEFNTWQV